MTTSSNFTNFAINVGIMHIMVKALVCTGDVCNETFYRSMIIAFISFSGSKYGEFPLVFLSKYPFTKA